MHVPEPADPLISQGEIVSTTVETGVAIVGAIVGLALGGPAGAVVGAAAPPLIGRAAALARNAWNRRVARASKILTEALHFGGLTPELLLDRLENDDKTADDFLLLIEEASRSNPGLDTAFATLIADFLSAGDSGRERILIIIDAMSGLRAIHLKVLQVLSDAREAITPSEMAQRVGMGQVELRSVVRGLETRAMIKDVGAPGVAWKIRTLGQGVVDAARSRQNG